MSWYVIGLVKYVRCEQPSARSQGGMNPFSGSFQIRILPHTFSYVISGFFLLGKKRTENATNGEKKSLARFLLIAIPWSISHLMTKKVPFHKCVSRINNLSTTTELFFRQKSVQGWIFVPSAISKTHPSLPFSCLSGSSRGIHECQPKERKTGSQ